MNILLADDDAAIRESVAAFLKQLGHRVRACGDGQEAVKSLEAEPAHLVLSDIQMPNMDGRALLERIRANPDWEDTMVVLFSAHGDVKGAVEAMRNGAYDYLLKPIDIRELAIITSRIGEYLALKREHRRLSVNFAQEVEHAAGDLKRELEDLRKAYAREVGTGGIGVFSNALRDVFRFAHRLHLNREIPVLLEGETGTGKDLLARYIHFGDGRVTTPFIGLNCAAISPGLFESELFGYEAGAFTGGKPHGQKGKLELARGGTVFLDEITELPIECQAKLLRVIQERRYYPVGGLREQTADVRFICATNRDIRGLVESGVFREDLFYRLNVGFIHIPPLRERRGEILPLAYQFLADLAKKRRTPMHHINPAAAEILELHPWPGNVRQLKNTMERVALISDDPELLPGHLDFLLPDPMTAGQDVSPVSYFSSQTLPLPEHRFDLHAWTLGIVRRALDVHQGNRSRTARYLGLTRNELYTYLKYLDPSDLTK